METLLLNAEKYVFGLLTKDMADGYLYHSISHTQRVVQAAKELIVGEQVSEVDANILLLAAWFHDVGYLNGADNHEKESVKIARNFLAEYNIDESIIDQVSQLILATKKGYQPQKTLEKIMIDADCYHVCLKNYFDVSDLLREELKTTLDITFSDEEWVRENIQFLTKKHHFYSSYAQLNWQLGKDSNIALLFKKLKKLQQETQKELAKKEELDLKKLKANSPERGIETMFRVTLRNHITLSDIADTKANILLSVNAIIVSLALSNLLPKLDKASNYYLIIPTIIFVVFTIITIILSVLATRPNITSGKFTKMDVKNKKVNLLFFGNFHKMSLEDFEWAIGEVMKDKDYLYSSLTKDLYFLGKVLDRKYKILRVTYLIFIIGLVISVLAFGFALQWQTHLVA
ncbi:hypothetical protein GCM10011416_04480 [Polaribacter pacificus]|uniref:HD domain-containing protein n=1 Tax=Polaribacter pacificus TaxID=1775173 RepID=A0A917MB74_9FLAO|nr:Pycsar system effector family protein [Polaribacter pacificus]GGG91050.1 hypothetical protein GCM10011416_04480 [Polaribacter pacificus]